MSELLKVTDLHVRYPLPGGLRALLDRKRNSHVDVVQGVSLAVSRGETLAVVGESGSGKTTLAMALCGLAPVTSGDVRFAGKSIAADKGGFLKPDRRRVALMFQDSAGSLSPRMTVRKLLEEPFRVFPDLTDDAHMPIEELLSMVGLSADIAKRYPHQLSGGQARRVCLARALAQKPELLIADEPTAGLDVSIQGEVLNLLSEMQKKLGLGIMIITHNLNIVRHVAEHMAIMYLGRFLEQGRSEMVFRQPRHPYTAALLAANPGANPDARPDRIELKGEVPSLLRRPNGCEFHPRCPRVQANCREKFPHLESADGPQAWHCFHAL